MSLFVRLSYSYDQLSQFWDRLEKSCETLVVYEHNTGLKNCHCHFYVTGCTVSTDTLKNWIKKVIPDVPKTHWSFKTADNDGCITYMSKGVLDPVRTNKIGLERIALLKSQWIPVPDIRAKRVREQKVVTAYDMAVEVHETISQLGIENDYSNFREYAQQAIRVHHKYRKPFCEYSIRKVIHTAFSMSTPGREALVERIVRNFSQ